MVLVPGAQLLPEQQPRGHETLSHVQVPFTQCRPGAQAGALPHVQVPIVEQLSAVIGSQLMQVPPPVPQAGTPGG